MRKGNSGEENGEENRENSGHYGIASSRPPERRPLERRTLVPIVCCQECVGRLEKKQVIFSESYFTFKYLYFCCKQALAEVMQLSNLAKVKFRCSITRTQTPGADRVNRMHILHQSFEFSKILKTKIWDKILVQILNPFPP